VTWQEIEDMRSVFLEDKLKAWIQRKQEADAFWTWPERLAASGIEYLTAELRRRG
jgi:hypothetical protein